jgi:primase-polymerase (primpol)-like protein
MLASLHAGKAEAMGDDFCNSGFNALPNQMCAAKRWLLHRHKKPYYVDGTPRRGLLDSPADQSRLATFEEALRHLQGNYTGLGFALGPDGTGNHWQGIDLDDLSQHPGLADLLTALPGYVEKSPSGNGVHAIGHGKPFNTLGSNGTGIEAYAAGRFFTVTGNAL